MADIRINALANTASSTASDDYLAVDGATNGTRKLSAYSPTFGGNLTVSGTGASTFGGTVRAGAGSGETLTAGSLDTAADIGIKSTQGIVQGNARIVTFTSGNTILTGNLTVSGTGTSSIGGEPSTGLATYTGNLRIQSAGNGPAAVNGIELQNSQSGSGYGYKIYTNNSNDYIGIAGRFGSATWTEFLAIKQNTGNLLVGTTTDGGQKLQVSGSAIFGSTNTVQLSNPTGQIIRQQFSASTVGLRLEADSANGHAVIGTSSNHSLVLRSNDTTALTLDSSQNATFQNTVTLYTVGASSTGQNSLIFTGADGNGNVRTPAKIIGKQAGNGGYGNLVLQTAFNNSLVDALTLDSSQNATFAGSIAIGNTVQTAVSVASTHKVTISIGGSTYYLLATNV